MHKSKDDPQGNPPWAFGPAKMMMSVIFGWVLQQAPGGEVHQSSFLCTPKRGGDCNKIGKKDVKFESTRIESSAHEKIFLCTFIDRHRALRDVGKLSV